MKSISYVLVVLGFTLLTSGLYGVIVIKSTVSIITTILSLYIIIQSVINIRKL